MELAPGRRIAVCPDGDGPLARRLAAQGFDIVVNPDEALGLSCSLARGIAEAARGPQAAAPICLADMPFVTLGHLQQLLKRFDPGHAPGVAQTAGTVPMPAARVAPTTFARLQGGGGVQGSGSCRERG